MWNCLSGFQVEFKVLWPGSINYIIYTVVSIKLLGALQKYIHKGVGICDNVAANTQY